ncbi:MAG TPA: hypothetical protein VLT86_17815 [Vicinamibacterales bacterium]|nr:hypothetical protein [Vicinamibacterales bacterium]
MTPYSRRTLTLPGVPFLEKGTRDVSPLFKKAVNPPATSGRGGQ